MPRSGCYERSFAWSAHEELVTHFPIFPRGDHEKGILMFSRGSAFAETPFLKTNITIRDHMILGLSLLVAMCAKSRPFLPLATKHNYQHGVRKRQPTSETILLIGRASSRMGSRKELLPFPNGRLSIEHALKTLHRAVPSASTIYVSLHDET